MALLQKKVKKTIRVGDYLKKAKYAKPVSLECV